MILHWFDSNCDFVTERIKPKRFVLPDVSELCIRLLSSVKLSTGSKIYGDEKRNDDLASMFT